MQSRGGIPIKCFKWKNPGEGFELKKTPGGVFPTATLEFNRSECMYLIL